VRLSAPALSCAVIVVALAGCGNQAADLFVASRSGSVPGAALRMRVIDDGQVVCNGGRSHDIDSKQLIDARRLVEDLQKPAKARRVLAPGHPSIMRFSIRTQDGTVAFSDTSPRQPPVFYRAAQLIRTLARGPCHLPR
jgi:hypothetical protein